MFVGVGVGVANCKGGRPKGSPAPGSTSVTAYTDDTGAFVFVEFDPGYTSFYASTGDIGVSGHTATAVEDASGLMKITVDPPIAYDEMQTIQIEPGVVESGGGGNAYITGLEITNNVPQPPLSIVGASVGATGAPFYVQWDETEANVFLVGSIYDIYVNAGGVGLNAYNVPGVTNPTQIDFEGPGVFYYGDFIELYIAAGTFQGDSGALSEGIGGFYCTNDSQIPKIAYAIVGNDGINGYVQYNRDLTGGVGVGSTITVSADGTDLTAYINSVSGNTVYFNIVDGATYIGQTLTVTVPGSVLQDYNSGFSVPGQYINADNYSELMPEAVYSFESAATDQVAISLALSSANNGSVYGGLTIPWDAMADHWEIVGIDPGPGVWASVYRIIVENSGGTMQITFQDSSFANLAVAPFANSTDGIPLSSTYIGEFDGSTYIGFTLAP